MRLNHRKLGRIVLALGIAILLALLLPSCSWPLCLGLFFVFSGCCLLRR